MIRSIFLYQGVPCGFIALEGEQEINAVGHITAQLMAKEKSLNEELLAEAMEDYLEKEKIKQKRTTKTGITDNCK
jgi:hypothetical protein